MTLVCFFFSLSLFLQLSPKAYIATVTIDFLAIQQKSLDRALFVYIFIHEIQSSGVRASITIVNIRKFYKT